MKVALKQFFLKFVMFQENTFYIIYIKITGELDIDSVQMKCVIMKSVEFLKICPQHNKCPYL